jgi:glutathione S-transferase
MDLLLYQRADCPFCLKLKTGLLELGLEHETVNTVLGEKHPDVVALNPRGTVPILVDRDLVIAESAVALEYVNDRAEGPLFGQDPQERARIRLTAQYSDGAVGAALRDIIFEKRAKPEADWDRARIADGVARWRAVLDQLEGWCGEEGFGGQGFGGESFTAADCALMARFALADAYGAGVTPDHPRLYGWYGRERDRPSVRVAFPRRLPMAGQEMEVER